MSDVKTVIPIKRVVFVRNNVENEFMINPTDSDEELRNTIKTTFGLLHTSYAVLENINTNVILGSIKATTILCDPDPNPKYRVIISEDQQPQLSWRRSCWRLFILPFLSKSCWKIFI